LRKIIYFAVAMALFLLSLGLATIQISEAQDNYIPSVSLENYWETFGLPKLDASLAGTSEFERGDTVDLYIDLTNYGRIMGFDADKKADTRMEQTLADRELDYEREKTTALGITGTLRSSVDFIEVKSGDQVIESLRSGEKAIDPMIFTIKIGNHVPAGEYPLFLDLTYDYQYNAEVDADELDPEIGLRGFQAAYWYENENQSIEIPVVVKKESDFEITATEGELMMGQQDGIIEVTYKNIGEDPANDAIARLSVFKPFSSTDDQAYIGTLGSGEEITVKFKIDVDDDATPKPYGINSEIKYTDTRGDTVISESMKIPVNVSEAGRSYKLPLVILLILLIAGAAALYRRRKA